MLALEDAPRSAPMGFASPVAEPLSRSTPAKGPDPIDSWPRPDELTVQAGPALDALAASPAPGRDPHEPFDAVQQLVTNTSGPRDPRVPFNVNSSDEVWSAGIDANAAGQPFVHAAPPTGSPVGATPNRVSLGESLRATGWPMLAALAVGVLIGPLSLLALLAAWMLCMLSPPTALALRRVYALAMSLMVGVVFVALVSQVFDPMTLAVQWARWVCLALLVVCPWVMHGALARRTGQASRQGPDSSGPARQ